MIGEDVQPLDMIIVAVLLWFNNCFTCSSANSPASAISYKNSLLVLCIGFFLSILPARCELTTDITEKKKTSSSSCYGIHWTSLDLMSAFVLALLFLSLPAPTSGNETWSVHTGFFLSYLWHCSLIVFIGYGHHQLQCLNVFPAHFSIFWHFQTSQTTHHRMQHSFGGWLLWFFIWCSIFWLRPTLYHGMESQVYQIGMAAPMLQVSQEPTKPHLWLTSCSGFDTRKPNCLALISLVDILHTTSRLLLSQRNLVFGDNTSNAR